MRTSIATNKGRYSLILDAKAININKIQPQEIGNSEVISLEASKKRKI